MLAQQSCWAILIGRATAMEDLSRWRRICRRAEDLSRNGGFVEGRRICRGAAVFRKSRLSLNLCKVRLSMRPIRKSPADFLQKQKKSVNSENKSPCNEFFWPAEWRGQPNGGVSLRFSSTNVLERGCLVQTY